MPYVVLPMLDASTAVDVDSSAAPVDPAAAPPSAAAPIAAGCPPPQCVGCAERDPSRDDAGADIAGVAPVVGVGRIVRVRPIAENHLRLVVGNVNTVSHSGFNVDEAPVLIFLYRYILLSRCDQLLPVVGFGPQPLHGVHHLLLLREKRLAKFLGPLEMLVHHLQN